jgi:hypothetical protein
MLDATTIVRTAYRTRDNTLRRLHRSLGSDATGTTAATATWTPKAVTRRALSLISPTFGDFPDPFRGWVDTAVSEGVAVALRERVDAICSLCPPATAHVVASEIARKTGIPWVAQFDDLYSFHLERQRRPEWRAFADRQHREWMKQATFAGAITPAMLAYLRRTYGVDGDVVMVGYDPDESPLVERTKHDRLRLAYTGSVYPGDERPDMLFDALDRAITTSREADPIEMIFAGTGRDEELATLAAQFPAATRASRFVGRLAPDAALRLQREADALVLLNCTDPSPDEGTLSYPAKAFEYLNAGKPILALPSDPGGWGDRLLETTGAGLTAKDADQAAAIIVRWLTEWKRVGEVPYEGIRHEIENYSQPRQAATLARLLDRAVDHPSRAQS